MIDSYSFGSMVIDGKEYTMDLIILPDGKVLHPWWRKTGHGLSMSDLDPVVAASPLFIVVGTGQPGLMKPDRALCEQLETKGIESRILPTREAAEEYNALCRRHKRVSGCFHLTC